MLLVAEVQAGAIPLLTLLRETGVTPPPTLLFDQEGSNMQAAIKALQLGVQEYILASEPPGQRELRARVMAERILSASVAAARPKSTPVAIAPVATDAVSTAATSMDFQWDPESHVIYIDNKYIRLSPVEGRVFDMLVARHNKTVSMEELLSEGMKMQHANVDEGIKLLRPHMMRLRNKLERHPRLAHRIVNVRGNGYMFI
jgi:DNA-binding response OmpR family regulator